MNRYYYSSSISNFLETKPEEIIGHLARNSEFSDELTQKDAWFREVVILKDILMDYEGKIFFEYSIPRMGRRIDVVLVIKGVIFILEFKIGETKFTLHDIDQVYDYALDLKNFHETSSRNLICPILIASKANSVFPISIVPHLDNLLAPITTGLKQLKNIIDHVLAFASEEVLNADDWANGAYSPTPTIIEAAKALYSRHSVVEISRKDASAKNLKETSKAISEIITFSKEKSQKSICFITGVPGAGKTLVGLDIATKHLDKEKGITSVFLSGNGPLVAILREALTRDKVKREKAKGRRIKKGEVLREVKLFIQNVHHFRDECLVKVNEPPFDHVAIFDEAQRAWSRTQTANFMKRRKNVSDFTYSEPEFLVSCLDRHRDWAVIICLVGGGQEINTGEAGIAEWINAVNGKFPSWKVYVSNKLTDSEYAAGEALQLLKSHRFVEYKPELHLSVSLRSFRAENLSLLIKNLLDLKIDEARENYISIKKKYPIVLCRDISVAKNWLKSKARGTERYGIVVSSQAERLKPHAIDVKSPMDPVHWFLNEKDDVRSSYYLEDVATEFSVQGLELDWACVTWDGDFRFLENEWGYFSFVGNKWNKINKPERKLYLKNAYRVLLTRARQGMIIVIPRGDASDPTRNSEFYDHTFDYLRRIGFEEI